MSDDYERDATATRDEAAALLRRLADGVDAGSVELDDGAETVEIPDDVTVELEYETEDGESELEVELEWGRAADEEEAGESDADSGHGATPETDAADAQSAGDDGEESDTRTDAIDATAETDGEAVEAAADAEPGESGAEAADEADHGDEQPTETPIETLVRPGTDAESRATFELFTDRAGEWRWRLRHRNGNVIADSGEGYTRKHNARNGLQSVMANAPGADVVEGGD